MGRRWLEAASSQKFVEMLVQIEDVSPEARGRLLYIVEDSPAVSQALARLLSSRGFVVRSFAAAEPALAAAAVEPPDAALIDVHLPTRSGLELTAQLREMLGTKLPVIILSGDTRMRTLNQIAAAGAATFLAKPATPAALLDAINKCFSDRPSL